MKKTLMIIAAIICIGGTRVMAQSMTINNLVLTCPAAHIILYAHDAGHASHVSNPFNSFSNTSRRFATVASQSLMGCPGGLPSSSGWVGGVCATPLSSGWDGIDVYIGPGVIHGAPGTIGSGVDCMGNTTNVWWYDDGFGNITVTITP